MATIIFLLVLVALACLASYREYHAKQLAATRHAALVEYLDALHSLTRDLHDSNKARNANREGRMLLAERMARMNADGDHNR